MSGCCWPTGVILRNEGRSAGLRDVERSLGGGLELLTGAGEPEWGALGVSADRPALAGVDDLAAERQHPIGCGSEVADREIREREAVARARAAFVHPERDPLVFGLPAVSVLRLAALQRRP